MNQWVLLPDGRRMLEVIEGLPEDEREVWQAHRCRSPQSGHAWARKSLENMDESLFLTCDLRKVREEWNL